MIGEQISHYRLEEKLGAGTYGVVYKGVHVGDEEFKVAIKVVQPSLIEDPKFVDSLKKECRRLDRLDHSAIVRFRDLVLGDDMVAMVLELLEGKDLHDRIVEGPMPFEEVVRVIERGLEGLAYAHGEDVIHRDIKPSNMFICNDGRVKILDFGIARAAQSSQATQTGTMKGTLDYMAPERFTASGGGATSDVYAMGLVAWGLVAGKPACPDGDLAAKLGWHLGVGVSDIRGVRSDCPAWLADVINILAAKQMADRPADGAAALKVFQERRAQGTQAQAQSPATTARPAAPSTVALDQNAVAEAIRQVKEEQQVAAAPAAPKPANTTPAAPVTPAPAEVTLAAPKPATPAMKSTKTAESKPKPVPSEPPPQTTSASPSPKEDSAANGPFWWNTRTLLGVGALLVIFNIWFVIQNGWLDRGGPFIWLLLLATPVCVALFIVRVQKAQKQELPGLGLALVTGLVSLGLLGATIGEYQMWEAVAFASESKHLMVLAGMAVSIIPLQFSLVLALFVAVGFGAVWAKTRHLDLPSSKRQTATRWMGYSSALLLCIGLAIYLISRSQSAYHSYSTGRAEFYFDISYLALLACLLSGITTLVSLISVFRGPNHRSF
jgi:serine/threonine protein kinase